VSADEPANADGRPQSTFEAARSAAIDALLETIEAAERRLLAVKRATSFEELTQAGG
jgi:hypothetical protein